MHERVYWLGFSVFPGVGPKRFASLLAQFGNAKTAWEATEEALEQSLGNALLRNFIQFRAHFDHEKYEQALREKRITYVTLQDKAYPQLLKQASNPPFILYVKGENNGNDINNQRTIAIVGTRKSTSYGEEVTRQITTELVCAGYTIVSGLAIGVDTIAHTKTIADNGKTVAVLGCGIDCCYPPGNERLYKDIIASGGNIVSEWGLGFPPNKGSFPSRNRIIAGLSQAVIVTEGAADSGALYTATEAFTMNRPVFAVPGPITSNLSKGPHSLIEKGAKLITGAQDVLQALGVKHYGVLPLQKIVTADSSDEQKIITVLQNEELLFDEISKKANIDAARLSIVLTMMEMKKKIKNTGGGKFALHAS